MLKSIIATSLLFIGLQTQAMQTQAIDVDQLTLSIHEAVQATDIMNWTVGDTTDYNISGGIIKGTMHGQVREKIEEGYWVQQDANLGFMGNQKVEVLYDKNSGQVLKLLVNGKEQTPPDANDNEILEMRDESVTVPKGTFSAVYVKMRNKKDNNTSEAWIQPQVIPMGGMIKTVSPSQIGKITVELTDFKKQ